MQDLQALRFHRRYAAGVDARLVDIATAAVCAVLALASLAGWILPIPSDDGNLVRFHPADVLGLALVLLGTGALVWRRQHPFAVVAAVGISSFLVGALGYGQPPLPAAELVIVYTVASSMPLAVSALATIMTGLSIVAADHLYQGALNDDKLLAYLLSLMGAWAVGHVLKVSHAQAAIAQENVFLMTRHQRATTHRAVRQEQERISRELHDVIAHSVGVMVAQASSARLVFWKQPEYACDALSSIESTGRAALAEMRVLLRVLHADGEDRAAVEPAATLARLPHLLESVEAAGLPVKLSTLGAPVPLPHSVDLAAYRIIQESLTNCLKHAGSAQVTVRIRYQPEALEVQVSDDGVEPPAGDPGRGLLGMRQRATLLGGELIAARLSSGFEVRATLPYPERQPWPSES